MKAGILIAFGLACVSWTATVRGADSLVEALTFHASFDRGVDADYARGDGALYTVAATKPEVKLEKGLPKSGETQWVVGGGHFGGALKFTSQKAPKICFKAEKNLVYAANDWSGSVSFWLRVTPDEDLEPGYTDPMQITPRSALDACFFCEFGIEDPRPFRLGVFADAAVWNPEMKPAKEIALGDRPLLTVENPPFSRDRWTHVVFTFDGFNTGTKEGVARLYLDGALKGELTGREQTMTWDVSEAQIRLGVKFIGMLDEVLCFDRALTAEEVTRLHGLKEPLRGVDR